MANKILSRKFWVVLGNLALIFVNHKYQLNIPVEEIAAVTGVSAVYVIAQSVLDARKK